MGIFYSPGPTRAKQLIQTLSVRLAKMVDTTAVSAQKESWDSQVAGRGKSQAWSVLCEVVSSTLVNSATQKYVTSLARYTHILAVPFNTVVISHI